MIAIGSDHAGFALKQEVVKYLKEKGLDIKEMGCMDGSSCDYPMVAKEVCNEVTSGRAELAILICGTGLGISIAANKIKGVRCALCTDPVMARLTREHNDANMLAMGARIIGGELARGIVKAFLETDFSNGKRHMDRINKITELERAK